MKLQDFFQFWKDTKPVCSLDYDQKGNCIISLFDVRYTLTRFRSLMATGLGFLTNFWLLSILVIFIMPIGVRYKILAYFDLFCWKHPHVCFYICVLSFFFEVHKLKYCLKIFSLRVENRIKKELYQKFNMLFFVFSFLIVFLLVELARQTFLSRFVNIYFDTAFALAILFLLTNLYHSIYFFYLSIVERSGLLSYNRVK